MINEYQIEQAICPPTKRVGRAPKYPFSKLKAVNDSFFVPDSDAIRRQVAVAASGYGKRHGIKLATRKDGEGTRVYRIA